MHILLPYYCHIMLLHDFFLALFPPQFPIFGGLSPWKIPAMILRSLCRSSICSENFSHIFSYMFQYGFPRIFPYFPHIFPYSSTSIPNVNHQHRAPTSPSCRRWCPRSFWRTAWSLANVRRVLGKMMVGTKVTKICINHRYSQSIRYIYIYMICVYVCVYYIYIYVYIVRVFFKSLLVWESGKKKTIYIYVCIYRGIWEYIVRVYRGKGV